MISYVVYIDHEHAKIFKMKPGETETMNLHHHVHLHHKNNQDDKKKDSGKMFHEIAKSLNAAREILILGHGTAKDQFVHHLNEHCHKAVAEKIVGIETVDKPTEKQVLAIARKFFKTAHLYSKNS